MNLLCSLLFSPSLFMHGYALDLQDNRTYASGWLKGYDGSESGYVDVVLEKRPPPDISMFFDYIGYDDGKYLIEFGMREDYTISGRVYFAVINLNRVPRKLILISSTHEFHFEIDAEKAPTE